MGCCGESKVYQRGFGGGFGAGPGGVCWCPNCGYEEPHQVGMPCRLKTCPKCGGRMARKIGSLFG